MRKAVLIICLSILTNSVLFAQLNIVGVNTERPSSSIDYLESPLQIDKGFVTGSDYANGLNGYPYGNKYVMPKGQLVYHTVDYLPPFKETEFLFESGGSALIPGGIRFQGDSVIIGFPKGYYRLTGMILTEEEVRPFVDRLQDLNSKAFDYYCHPERFRKQEQSGKFSKKQVKKENDAQAVPDYTQLYFMNEAGGLVSYEKLLEEGVRYRTFSDIIQKWWSDCQSIANRYTDDALRELLATENSPSIRVGFYLFEDQNGNTYYSPETGKYFLVNVDYVNTLVNMFKGKEFFFIKAYPADSRFVSVEEYYSHRKVQIGDEESGFYGSINANHQKAFDFASELENKPRGICEDILVDGSDIIAVLVKGDNRFSVKLKKCLDKDDFTLKDDSDNVFGYSCLSMTIGDGIRMISVDECQKLKENSGYALSVIKMDREKRMAEYARMEERHKQEIIAKYGDLYGNKIINHKLALGMTKEMCIASIGYPSRILKNTTAFGEAVMYCYSDMMVLVFYNDQLKQITSSAKLY